MQLDEGFWMRWSDNFGRTFDGGRVVIPVRKNKRLHFLFLSLAYILQFIAGSTFILSFILFKRSDELQSMRKILGLEKPWELFVVTNLPLLMAWFILHSKRFAGHFNPEIFNPSFSLEFHLWPFHPPRTFEHHIFQTFQPQPRNFKPRTF